VEEFEYKLKEWLDVRYLNTTNSGTSALQLALTLSGVKHRSRVISTPMTCTATNTAIRAVGADIAWADIDPLSGNMDPNSAEDILKKEKILKRL
jgi:perosamine synthetase